jgi:hypothetical protein
MNVGIGKNTSLAQIGGKPPLHPRNNKNPSASPITTKCKHVFQNTTVLESRLDGNMAMKKTALKISTSANHVVGFKKSSLSDNGGDNFENMGGTGSSFRKQASFSEVKKCGDVPAPMFHPRTRSKKGCHRRTNNTEFSTILEILDPLLAPISLNSTLEARNPESRRLSDRPLLDVATLRSELGIISNKQHRKSRLCRRRHNGYSRKLSRYSPPHIPSVEERLEPLLIHQFFSAIQYFWALWTPKSSYVSKAVKKLLKDEYVTAFVLMRNALKCIRTKQLSKLKTASISVEKVRAWFTPSYQRTLAKLHCLIGVLQVFKRTKESIGTFQHGLGVLWGYDHHTEQQNHRLNYIMIQWLYQHWEFPILAESDVVRIAIDEGLSSVAVYEWLVNAMAIAWEPFSSQSLVPSHKLHSLSQQPPTHEKQYYYDLY